MIRSWTFITIMARTTITAFTARTTVTAAIAARATITVSTAPTAARSTIPTGTVAARFARRTGIFQLGTGFLIDHPH